MTETTHLPDGWTLVPLDTMVTIRDDLRQPVNADERSKRLGPYPYYGATGRVGWIDDFRLDGTYVLLGEDGAPFLDPVKPKAYIIEGKSWVNNHAHVLQAIDGLSDSRFIMYALNNFNYAGVVNGTTRLKLTQAAMRQMLLPLPPLAEQLRIVAAIEEQFTRLDAGVAALKSARARLKQYRAAVLKAAVEGELTKAWREAHPDTEPASELLAHIQAERRMQQETESKGKRRGLQAHIDYGIKLDDTPRSALPDSWCWATMEQLITYLRNGLSPKPASAPPGYKILRISAVRAMAIDFSEVRYLDLTREEVNNYIIADGDLLFTRYNGSLDLLGVAGLVRQPGESILHPDKLIRVKVASRIDPAYIEVAANVGESRAFIESRARTTAGQTGISGSDIKQMPLPLPPLQEQHEIAREIAGRISILAELDKLVESGLQRAERLRQSILTEAFSGRLTPQDPSDEPASDLLARIRETQSGAAPLRRRGQKAQ